MVAPRRRSGGGHAISGEKRFSIWLGAKEVFQDRRWEMDSVGDEEGHEFVPCEESLDNIVVTVEHLGNAVSQVRAETCSGLDGRVDLGV
jgi:hypothetical protein